MSLQPDPGVVIGIDVAVTIQLSVLWTRGRMGRIATVEGSRLKTDGLERDLELISEGTNLRG